MIVERNYWGIDVHIYTPRTEKLEDEEGLCLYKDSLGDTHSDTYTGEIVD